MISQDLVHKIVQAPPLVKGVNFVFIVTPWKFLRLLRTKKMQSIWIIALHLTLQITT